MLVALGQIFIILVNAFIIRFLYTPACWCKIMGCCKPYNGAIR